MKTTSEDVVVKSAKPWTVLSLLEWTTGYLGDRGLDEARLHVEILLAHVLDVPRLTLYLQFDRPLTRNELGRFKTLFIRRVGREPLQYILGETEFMGLRFAVDRRVLIPRPETEDLVGSVIAHARTRLSPPSAILDVGTGSGNVAVALAKMLPSSHVTTIDVSAAALEVARANATRHGTTNITFIECDILQEFQEHPQFDIIVSNPPYVSAEEYAALGPELRQFEPRVALTDDGDGCTFIRRITDLASARLSPGGALFMEIAYNQGETAAGCALSAGLREVVILKDFAGCDRILTGLSPGLSP